MKRVIVGVLFALAFLAGYSLAAHASVHGSTGVVSGCAYNTLYTNAYGNNDGCANANKSADFQNTTFFSSSAASGNNVGAYQSGQPFISRPTNHNVAGVDYPVGYYTALGSLADPTAGGLPSGCVYTAINSAYHYIPTVTCTGSSLTLTGWDFGANGSHTCITVDINVNGPVDIHNNRFKNGYGVNGGCNINNGWLLRIRGNPASNLTSPPAWAPANLGNIIYNNEFDTDYPGTQPSTSTPTITQSGTTITVTALGSGTISLGQSCTGGGISQEYIAAIVSAWNGTTGTYTASGSQTVSSPTAISCASGALGSDIIDNRPTSSTSMGKFYNDFINTSGRPESGVGGWAEYDYYNYVGSQDLFFADTGSGLHGEYYQFTGATANSLDDDEFNTVMQPAWNITRGGNGQCCTTIFLPGTGNFASPTTKVIIADNISVTNQPSGAGASTYANTSALTYNDTSVTTLDITNNYIDPTGALFCSLATAYPSTITGYETNGVLYVTSQTGGQAINPGTYIWNPGNTSFTGGPAIVQPYGTIDPNTGLASTGTGSNGSIGTPASYVLSGNSQTFSTPSSGWQGTASFTNQTISGNVNLRDGTTINLTQTPAYPNWTGNPSNPCNGHQ